MLVKSTPGPFSPLRQDMVYYGQFLWPTYSRTSFMNDPFTPNSILFADAIWMEILCISFGLICEGLSSLLCKAWRLVECRFGG